MPRGPRCEHVQLPLGILVLGASMTLSDQVVFNLGSIALLALPNKLIVT